MTTTGPTTTAMRSSTNVEIVAGIYEAFGAGDLDRVLARLAPDVAWLTPATLPWSRGDYHGTGEVREYFASFLEHLGEPAVLPDELIDAGSRVVAQGHEHGRAASTGRPFRARFTHTWTLHDGQVAEMRGIVDTAAVRDAFAAPPSGAAGRP